MKYGEHRRGIESAWLHYKRNFDRYSIWNACRNNGGCDGTEDLKLWNESRSGYRPGIICGRLFLCWSKCFRIEFHLGCSAEIPENGQSGRKLSDSVDGDPAAPEKGKEITEFFITDRKRKNVSIFICGWNYKSGIDSHVPVCILMVWNLRACCFYRRDGPGLWCIYWDVLLVGNSCRCSYAAEEKSGK